MIKHWLVVLGLVSLTFHAEAASLQQTLAAADALLVQLTVDSLVPQATYRQTHNRYWQGAALVDEVPAEGRTRPANPKAAIKGARSWQEMGIPMPATQLPLHITLHEYLGPLGPGYVFIGTVRHGGRLYRRSLGVGPETRTTDWIVVHEPDH